MKRAHPLLLILVLAAVLSSSAAADWLVMHDGSRIETRGPWRVEGARVIFTLPNGTLSALRKADVDLDASASATAAAKAPAPPPPAPRTKERRPPVMVLTNKNVAQASESVGDSGAAGEAPAREQAAPPGGVEVVTWESRDSRDVDGLEIVGTLKNNGVEIATNINVSVTIDDQQGSPLFDTTAFLRSTGLAPGKSTTFRALLPGIYSLFTDPRFDVQSGAVTVQGIPQPGEAEEAAAATADSGAGRAGGDAGQNSGAGNGTEAESETAASEGQAPPGVIGGVEPEGIYEEVPPSPESGGSEG